jgi:predicted metal-dependent phosphoesterase TrpH
MKLLYENETLMVFLFAKNSAGTGEFIVVMNKEDMVTGKEQVGHFFWLGISMKIEKNSHIHKEVVRWMDEKFITSY